MMTKGYISRVYVFGIAYMLNILYHDIMGAFYAILLELLTNPIFYYTLLFGLIQIVCIDFDYNMSKTFLCHG